MVKFKVGRSTVAEAKCNYDWKDAQGRRATGRVDFRGSLTDSEVMAVLKDDGFKRLVGAEFGTKYVCFVPEKINREPAAGYLIQAITSFLEAHPGVRKFGMDGWIE